jgi:hypothetical protein
LALRQIFMIAMGKTRELIAQEGAIWQEPQPIC